MKIDQNGLRALFMIQLAAAPFGTAAAAQSVACPSGVMPVIDLADPWTPQLRTAQLAGGAAPGSLTIRRPSAERKVSCPDSSGGGVAAALPVRLRTLYNSAYPLNVNNGAVWAGRGLSATLELGGTVRVGPLTINAYPLMAYQQNRAFELRTFDRSNASPYAYAGHAGIDWPQRFGDGPVRTIHAGQSSIEVAVGAVAAGVSTENLWIGPAQRMPLMMGSSAPGFPHAYAGTARGVDIGIGTLEAQVFWGRLRESAWFDGDASNDHNLLVGSTAAFEPAFARGLHLGAHRSWIVAWDQPDWSPLDYVVQPFVGLRDNPPDDNTLFSLFARWVLTPARMEVYAEWAREDGWADVVDLLREPNHSQAFLLGFQKLGDFGSATLRWWGELANLEHSQSIRTGRGAVTMYVHSGRIQGYTHRGQLLGAWIGPGSTGQILGVERMAGGRLTGLALERVRFDADAYYDTWATVYGQNGHDLAIAAWARHVEPLGPWHLAVTASLARRQNRHGVRFTGAQPPDLRWETNLHVDAEVRWVPGRGVRLSGRR